MDQAVVIVSGLPRSGTSLAMKMLEAGGMPVLIDNIRTPDEDNPKGYYEFERVKQIEHDQSWLPEAQGKVVKMISALLLHLPDGYTYQILFMRRAMPEILASQKRMLTRSARTDEISDERMAELYRKHLEKVEAWMRGRPNVQVIDVDYNTLMRSPRAEARKINTFLGNRLDVDQMVACVDQGLYRNRREPVT